MKTDKTILNRDIALMIIGAVLTFPFALGLVALLPSRQQPTSPDESVTLPSTVQRTVDIFVAAGYDRTDVLRATNLSVQPKQAWQDASIEERLICSYYLADNFYPRRDPQMTAAIGGVLGQCISAFYETAPAGTPVEAVQLILAVQRKEIAAAAMDAIAAATATHSDA